MDLKELQKYTKDLTVLYAEDEDSLREVTVELFKNYFGHIDSAKNGKEALSLYKEYQHENNKLYDIVITDLMMPNMNGKELAKAVLEFNPKQEVIVISAQADFDDVIELLNIGINKFMTKPIKGDALNKTLYDISQSIRKLQMEIEDKNEINEYNEILKKREDEKLKELQEFSNALNISAIVVKTNTQGIMT
ncbi:MAG: hypothetical protein DRG78_05555, partial [Epsilonproteobacteria bacterium]